MRKLTEILLSKNAKTTAVYYAGSFVLNVGNYLFHLMMMRMLLPEAYGEFLSYISFFSLLTIPASSIVTVVLRYAAGFYGKDDKERINYFFYYMLNLVVWPSLLLSILVIGFSSVLAVFLKAHAIAFVALGFNLLISFTGAILGAYLLAFQQFLFQMIAGGITLMLKLFFAYIFLSIGLGATGGVVAILLSGFLRLFVVFGKIKPNVYPRIKKKVKLNIKLKKFLSYSIIYAAGGVSLISVDVLLVRYFLPVHDSGIYSALSVLGRMIYFGLTPLSMLVLPMVSKRYAVKQKTKSVLWKLFAVTSGLGLLGVAIFIWKSSLMVRIFSGSQYVEGNGLLWGFAVAMLMYALSRLLLSYFMAVEKENSNLWLLVAMLLQPLLIIIWHNGLHQLMMINLVVQSILFIGLLVYYGLNNKNLT